MTAETCPECGWARRNVTPQGAGDALSAIAVGYRQAVERVQAQTAGTVLIRRRPRREVWSIAEYVAHTADALEHICRRAHLLLAEQDPELPRFGDPNTHDYSDADIADALARIEAACADLAGVFGSAAPNDLLRTGHNVLGATSLLDTAGYAVHEAGHHLHDIQQITLPLIPR